MKAVVIGTVVVVAGVASGLRAQEQPAADVASAAVELLDENAPAARRDELIEQHKAHSADLLRNLAEGLQPGTPEELRRIPTIWRVAVAAGKRNDEAELAAILDASLPPKGEPLRQWQAVVIGGGVVNGIGLAGTWPASRIEATLKTRPDLRERWDTAVEQSFAMADDEQVIPGTRYDALRMVALANWPKARPVLLRYLEHDNAELQQGAVSGLSDVQNDEAPQLLLENIDGLTDSNRALAVEALVRDGARYSMAKEALRLGILYREEITAAQERVKSRK